MARGRPATPLGTWGEINVQALDSGRFKAETRLRLWNGQSVRVQARGKSKTAATNALKAKCTQRLGASDTEVLTTTSTVKDLLAAWIETKTSVRPQTRDRYNNSIELHIVPAFGGMRLNEVTPAYLDTWLQAQPPGIGANIRTVLKGAFVMATRYGLIASNPMAVVRPVDVQQKEVRALTVEEIPIFRKQIKKSGNQTLIDVVDFVLATGLRAGEVLGLVWSDIDLDAAPPLLRTSGTLTYSSEKGHIKQGRGKTGAAARPIQLPAVAVEIVTRRKEVFGPLEMIFPSGAGTFIWENNFNRWLRDARGEQFKWVTIHSLRKTLGSIVADQLGPHKAADVLGHTDSRLTERVYYQRNYQGVPIGDVVDAVLPLSKKSPNNTQKTVDTPTTDRSTTTVEQDR
ncbi:tyrosine-type recombinase/integrase [Corynebacterium flavescens]|uniref:tyrosine-type recombinase/integrase n=1 Tax=Corynebacterium flavescens TaxID=28028 RepID=UPI003FD36CB9